MRKRGYLAVSALLLAAACRERVETTTERDPFGKPTESVTVERELTIDEDFAHTRTTYSTHARERLDRIDARIRELEARGEVRAKELASELRVRRDQLASRLQTVGQQARAGWDQFEADLSRGFDNLEKDLDAAID